MKKAEWKCVHVGSEAEIKEELQKYEKKGYFTTVVPRIDLKLGMMTSDMGLYIRKVTLNDLRKKAK